MERKDRIDRFGMLTLVAFSATMGFNQVLIKLVNGGIQPVFAAGLRSAGAVVCVYLFMRWRHQALDLRRETLPAGVLMGLVFAIEFVFLFLALDLTTVTRSSIILYSMPVWFGIVAHFTLPGERMTRAKVAGLVLAFGGVVLALVDGRFAGGSFLGDLFALFAAFCWTGVAFIARGSKLNRVTPQMQLMWQTSVSAVLLLAVAPLFGPLLRDPSLWHWAGLGVQTVGVVAIAFMVWLWVMSIYPAASVAAFGFLSPVFGVGLGALVLGERVGPALLLALVMVASGLWLINRPPSSPQA